MQFTIHTGLKTTPFELHHGHKPRTEVTNIMQDGKSFLSNWCELPVSANNRPKIPIYVIRNGDGEVSTLECTGKPYLLKAQHSAFNISDSTTIPLTVQNWQITSFVPDSTD